MVVLVVLRHRTVVERVECVRWPSGRSQVVKFGSAELRQGR